MAERDERSGADLYAVLGLAPAASSQEIRAAYQQIAGDIVAGQTSPIQRQAIEEAFETLGDPIRRLRYDAQSAAPPPPRFHMPTVRLPGVRLSLPSPRLPAGRPNLPHVDPMLAAAIALVVIVGATVVVLPLVRGRGKASPPAQSVADLVLSPTATQAVTSPTPNSNARPAPGSPIFGVGPGGPGSSLLPLPSGATQGGLLGPATSGPASVPNEPPFLTGSAIVDMLRAVVAASAVHNAPPPSAAVPPPSLTLPSGPTNGLVQPIAPAGIPITSVGAVPPLAGAQTGAFPVSAAATTAPAPTSTPAPNHIAIPAGPVNALGVAPLGATRTGGTATAAPNRFVPAPTPSR